MLIDALAWPVASVIMVLLLRKSLAGIIPDLRRIKYGAFEAEFGGKLREIERKIGQAGLPATIKVTKPDALGGAEEKEEEYICRLADVSPRAAIAEVWRSAEVALREAAAADGRKDTSLFNIINHLHSKGILSSQATDVLRDLRDLRNKAVHYTDVELSVTQAIEYGRIVRNIISALRKSGGSSNRVD